MFIIAGHADVEIAFGRICEGFEEMIKQFGGHISDFFTLEFCLPYQPRPSANIMMVNEAWTRFRRENGGAGCEGSDIGTNYLDACRPVDGPAAARPRAAAPSAVSQSTSRHTPPSRNRGFVKRSSASSPS